MYVWLFVCSHSGSNSSGSLTDGAIRHTALMPSLRNTCTYFPIFCNCKSHCVYMCLYVWCMFSLYIYFPVLKDDAELGEKIKITQYVRRLIYFMLLFNGMFWVRFIRNDYGRGEWVRKNDEIERIRKKRRKERKVRKLYLKSCPLNLQSALH